MITLGIYIGRNLATGKVYIGSSKNCSKRIRSHINLLKAGKHCNKYLQNAWVKYGAENFVFEIVEACTRENRWIKEQWWIDNLKSSSSEHGYNLSHVIAGLVPSPTMSAHMKRRWEEDPDFRSTVLSGLTRGRNKTNSRDDPEFLAKRCVIFKAARDKAILRWKTDTELQAKQRRNNQDQWQQPHIRDARIRGLNLGRVKTNAMWNDKNSKVRKAREINLAKGSITLERLMRDPVWRVGRKTGSRTQELWTRADYRAKCLPKLKVTQAKGAAAIKEKWDTDPIYRETRLAALRKSNQTAEFKKRHREKLARQWANPIYCENHSRRMKARWAKYRAEKASKEIV